MVAIRAAQGRDCDLADAAVVFGGINFLLVNLLFESNTLCFMDLQHSSVYCFQIGLAALR